MHLWLKAPVPKEQMPDDMVGKEVNTLVDISDKPNAQRLGRGYISTMIVISRALLRTCELQLKQIAAWIYREVACVLYVGCYYA